MKSKVQFNVEAHSYEFEGQKLCPVSTWYKSFFPKFESDKIAEAIARREQKQGLSTTKEDVLARWTLVADNGTETHAQIEKYIKKKNKPRDFKAQQGIQAFRKIKNMFAPRSRAYPEVILHDVELGLAGTTDLVLKVGKKVILVDWKTNKEIKKDGYGNAFEPISDIPNANFYHYTLQLSTYAYMLERQGYKVQKCILAHLKEDGFELYELNNLKYSIEKMLGVRNGKDCL
jgi:ATP-dependent exoDNAse (exonuclease V) beta subunit